VVTVVARVLRFQLASLHSRRREKLTGAAVVVIVQNIVVVVVVLGTDGVVKMAVAVLSQRRRHCVAVTEGAAQRAVVGGGGGSGCAQGAGGQPGELAELAAATAARLPAAGQRELRRQLGHEQVEGPGRLLTPAGGLRAGPPHQLAAARHQLTEKERGLVNRLARTCAEPHSTLYCVY
jgi:hypothetical protein